MSVLKKIHKFFTVLLVGCCTFFVSAHRPVDAEYKVKAVFLFNFSQFVEWPTSSYTSAGEPFVIGILGEDPFGTYLDEIIQGENVIGHPLVIQHYKAIGEVTTCHILFINQAEINKPEQSVINLKGKNILTVSDGNNFIKRGGMIRFFTMDDKIQIRINPEAAKAADLIISSKLLNIAEVVSQK